MTVTCFVICKSKDRIIVIFARGNSHIGPAIREAWQPAWQGRYLFSRTQGRVLHFFQTYARTKSLFNVLARPIVKGRHCTSVPWLTYASFTGIDLFAFAEGTCLTGVGTHPPTGHESRIQGELEYVQMTYRYAVYDDAIAMDS
jgi:hypothetical protein